jgi:hypothetical protein
MEQNTANRRNHADDSTTKNSRQSSLPSEGIQSYGIQHTGATTQATFALAITHEWILHRHMPPNSSHISNTVERTRI